MRSWWSTDVDEESPEPSAGRRGRSALSTSARSAYSAQYETIVAILILLVFLATTSHVTSNAARARDFLYPRLPEWLTRWIDWGLSTLQSFIP